MQIFKREKERREKERDLESNSEEGKLVEIISIIEVIVRVGKNGVVLRVSHIHERERTKELIWLKKVGEMKEIYREGKREK